MAYIENKNYLGMFNHYFFICLQGVRSSTVDACAHSNPCKNGGECLPTDQGPVCDCTKIDFKGLFCQEG